VGPGERLAFGYRSGDKPLVMVHVIATRRRRRRRRRRRLRRAYVSVNNKKAGLDLQMMCRRG
jgi:hypothetical protein